MNKEKILHIEFIRIFAIFCVIFIHSEHKGWLLYTYCRPGSITFFLYMAIDIIFANAVPLFLMISGAVLLRKSKEELTQTTGKRLVRIMISLLIFSGLHYSIWVIKTGHDGTIIDFFKKLYNAEIQVTYWYLYAYIAFVITLPYLKCMIDSFSKKDFLRLLLLSLLINGIIPILQFLLGRGELKISSDFNLWFTTWIILYPCLGYYSEHIYDIKRLSIRKLLLLWMLFAILVITTYGMEYYRYYVTKDINGSGIRMFYWCFSIVFSFIIYVTIKFVVIIMGLHHYAIITKCVTTIGSCTFGMYLIHMFVKNSAMITKLWNWIFGQNINKMFASFMMCGVIAVISFLIILVCKKIPIIKQLL